MEPIRKYLSEHATELGPYLFSFNTDQSEFVNQYLKLRKKERRVFSQSDIETLPNVAKNHPHHHEWEQRKQTADRFRSYMKQRVSHAKPGRSLTVLDLGAGNGWFVKYLSDIEHLNFILVDVNSQELQQATKLLKSEGCLSIIGDVLSTRILPDNSVDMVIINSSFQYFPSLNELIGSLGKYLREEWEIHILDTMIYTRQEAEQAEIRSRDYYRSQQMESMIAYYHHHTWHEFADFNYQIMYDPRKLHNKLKSKIMPISRFPWIKLSDPSSD